MLPGIAVNLPVLINVLILIRLECGQKPENMVT
jgi:hypothetical protein